MKTNIPSQWQMVSEGAGGGYANALQGDLRGDHARLVLRESIDAAGRHLLVLRFAVFNVAALAFLGAAWTQGWVHAVLGADDTGLSLGIFLVFLAGLGICAHRIWGVSIELEQARATNPGAGSYAARYRHETTDSDSGSRAITASRLKLVLTSHISSVIHIANSLVLLGLVGTVIGFIIALSGVDPQSAGNVDSIAPMVSELIRGMSVALYTTLVGAILHLWLKVNYLILAGGAVQLIDRLVAHGEEVARV